MAYSPAEIRGNRFPIRVRGYQTDAVDSFLARLAADYQLALDATSQLTQTDYYLRRARQFLQEVREKAQKEIDEAEREARAITRQAEEEVSRIQQAAAEEAHAIKDSAGQAATALLAAAELLSLSAVNEARDVQERIRLEVARTRARESQKSEAIVNSARGRAANLLSDAKTQARKLLDMAQEEAERLHHASALQLSALQSYERRSTARIHEMQTLLKRLTHISQDAASQAIALEHDAAGISHGKWFALLEPRDVQLATIASLMTAPTQKTVEALAAPLRDLGYILNQLVARKQREEGAAGKPEP